MNYLLQVLTMLGTIAATIWSVRYFTKPIYSELGGLRNEMNGLRTDISELRADLRAVDNKYDKKIDEVRRDIVTLYRDMGIQPNNQVYRRKPTRTAA